MKLKNDSDTGDKKGSTARRKILQSAMLGGGALATTVPGKWRTPVVGAVVVPGHAQTTCVVGSGTSNTSGLVANITAAVINGGGDLIVVAEADLPEACRKPWHQDNESVYEEYGYETLSCTILSNGATLASTNNDGDTSFGSAVGSGCTVTGQPCILSCSVSVGAGSHSLTSGDCVTMRFNINGTCVVSAVATVS